MANSANQNLYEIFLSCERKNEPLCVKLCYKLTKQLFLKIWTIAINAKTVDKPLPLVKKAINSSQIFVCCMTVKYTESKECIDEIILANEKGLRGIIVLLEPTVPHNFPGLSFTSDWPKIPIYEDPEELAKWTGPNYDLLVEKIMELLNKPVPGKERNELDTIFHEMQTTIDKGYEKNWKKIDGMPSKEDSSFSAEIQSNGSISIGTLKNDKFNFVNGHIANWVFLKSKFSNSKQNEEFRKFCSLLKFCFQYMGKSAIECLNKEIDGFFKVINANPVSIEFKKTKETFSLDAILTKYFKFIANTIWLQWGVKIQKAMISVPADYGLLEKGDLKTFLKNNGIEILQIVSIPVTEALAIQEKNRKQRKNEEEENSNKYILINWKTGAVSVTAFETMPNKPLQLLNSFNDLNLTNRMLEKEQMDYIQSKLKDPNEVDLTDELVEKAFLDAYSQFKKGTKSAKIKLSKSNEIEITFKEMKRLCQSYVEKSSQLLNAILNERGLKLTDFKRVHYSCPLPFSDLTGNMYRDMFKDYQLNENYFVFEQNLDTLQSVGNMAEDKMRGKNTSVAIPLDFNFGLRTYAGIFDVNLKRGASLPAEATQVYTTVRDNQTSVSLRIFSGERPICRYCDFLGQLVVTDLPKKKAGEIRLQVTFKIDESGLLSIDAKEASQSEKIFKTSIDRSNMKKQKETGIFAKQKYEKEDNEFVEKVKYATGNISKLQDKYRDNETISPKVDNWIDYLIKQGDNLSIDSINRLNKEIDQLI